jgi:hypothetical protein
VAAVLVLLGACTGPDAVADLVITGARVFDTRTGAVLPDRTIVVRRGVIESVLGRPELEAALDEARRLGMTATGHIDYQVVSLDTALDLGLDSFEHGYDGRPGARQPRAW